MGGAVQQQALEVGRYVCLRGERQDFNGHRGVNKTPEKWELLWTLVIGH